MNTTILCRDRFEGHPLSVLPGRECAIEVPGPGWACPEHHEAADRIYDTLITDVPDEREVKARRAAQPMDPELRALITAARTYLVDCEHRQEAGSRLPDFIAGLLADPKYGTKWFRITEKMAQTIIRIRDGEQARAEHAKLAQAGRERMVEVHAWIAAHADYDEFAANLKAGLLRYGSLTDRQYDAVLRNIGAAAIATVMAPPITQDGWYKVGDDIFKVQKAVHGSGQLYAKRLVVSGPGEAEWVYEPGMVRRLTADQRLSVEDAAAFGRLYGICAVCGTTLTDESSIERGIGPVCIKRLGA
jgi:hypothetical protein